jgi:hypothetical protein
MRSESERFWDLIESASPDHSKCWVWGGALTSRGYGHFRAADGTYVLAHRWSYERYVDEIPKDAGRLDRSEGALMNHDAVWRGVIHGRAGAHV